MMKIALTGIGGFLGAELARRLVADGHDVCAIVRPETQLAHIADLRAVIDVRVHDGSTQHLIDLVGHFAPDQVMHLASNFLAEHKPENIEELIRSNIQFPTQLLEAMAQAGCRQFVNTGTSWQHFVGIDYRPVNLYASTKQAFEDILTYYSDAHAVSTITLKLFDTYGPNDRRRKLIRLLMDASASGNLLEMSPGEQLIDMVHSDDVVSAFVLASRRLCGSAQPICESFLLAGERLSLRGLVALIEQIGGQKINVAWGARPYRKREVMNPIEVAGLILPGWSPKVSLEKGLRQMLDLYGRQ
jgi:nucleoside-diphosphate-sugar epimerase